MLEKLLHFKLEFAGEYTMKKLLLALVLFFVSASAMAEWALVKEEDEYSVYADFATIRKEGNKAKMWALYDYIRVQEVTGGKSASVKEQSEYDCKEKQRRLLAYSWFSKNMGLGNIVYTDSQPTKWRPITPKNAVDILWESACGKQPGK